MAKGYANGPGMEEKEKMGAVQLSACAVSMFFKHVI